MSIMGQDSQPIKITGILNITPDSFSDGGNYFCIDDSLKHAENLIAAGVDIIDVGGESSRPGSKPVQASEEIRRVIPVIKEIKKRFNVCVSIDTYKTEVAELAVAAGAEIVNDITAFRHDNGSMAAFVASHNVKVILMHMQGSPETMQDNPEYKDIIREVLDFFAERIDFALSSGISKDRIIIDPGIGFGKQQKHNLLLLKHLSEFKKLGVPLMVGPSRKSFIGNILNTGVLHRLEGTIAATLIAAFNGAEYLRVHDVEQIKKALIVFEEVMNAE